MHSLFHRPSHSATTRGHVLGAPRLYDIFANIFFFGRRRATFQALIATARVQPGQRVLDVGCGTGYFARLLAQAVGRDGLVVGVDPSTTMISYASRKTRHASNCRFQVGTAEALEFPAEHFDVVVSSLVMHHLPEDLRVAALREMWRVLRPGAGCWWPRRKRPDTVSAGGCSHAFTATIGWRAWLRILSPWPPRPGSVRSTPTKLHRGCATCVR